MAAKINQQANNDRAKVVLFPPLVGLTLLITGVVLHALVPFSIFKEPLLALILGLMILFIGIMLQFYCLKVFKKANTTPLFKKPTLRIARNGPYAKSRNPIYIAVLIQFSGMALIFNSWWLVAFIPILYLYLSYGVIRREEKYLESKFKNEYNDYKSKVPRWL
jgi:protein-S-isoprenylcysteine O-methyltransferase Ste14